MAQGLVVPISAPPYDDSGVAFKGSSDITKGLRFELDTYITTATTRVISIPDRDIDLTFIPAAGALTTNCIPKSSLGGAALSCSTASDTGSAGFTVDNGAAAQDIFVAKDNASAVFTIANSGDIQILTTVTTAGTTGDQTINKPTGCVNFAIAATDITVTDSFSAATSKIFSSKQTNDATCLIKSVVPGTGSFAIHMTAGCAAETRVCFMVIN